MEIRTKKACYREAVQTRIYKTNSIHRVSFILLLIEYQIHNIHTDIYHEEKTLNVCYVHFGSMEFLDLVGLVA